MEKRGILYFFLVSLFLYNLIFSEIVILHKNKKVSLIDKILKEEVKGKKQYRLVEVFIKNKEENKTRNLARIQSKGGGKITKEKGYSYYNDVRFLGEIRDNIKVLNNNDNNQILNPNQRVNKLKKTLVNILPNSYRHEKVIINIDTNNNISIDAQRFEYADYLIKIAKKVFYTIVEFIPKMQILHGFIVAENGLISGTIALYFKENTFNVVFLRPFKSPTMNKLITRAFSYIKIDKPKKDLKLNFIIFSLKIHPSTLKTEANFKFDFFYKNKRYD